MRKLLLLLAPLTLAAGLASPAWAETPSFSCTAARSEVEKAICASPDLAREDAAMARLYAAAKRGARGDGQSSQGAAQLAWLRERAACETSKTYGFASRAQCLSANYRRRNTELATAALFADRDFAIDQRRRLDPASAPLVHAVVLYADHRPGASWAPGQRERIAALLREPFARLGREPMQGYGHSILKDTVPTLDAAFASDAAFAETVAILAAYTEGEQTPIVMPCAALIRNPALTEMLEPRFGSTIDNFLPRSDCDTALPPMPALTRLDERIDRTWPDCQGTIRFAGYRSYSAALDRARIGLAPTAAGRVSRLRILRGVAPQLAVAAVAELERVYLAYGGLSSEQARPTAHERVAELLVAAHQCGEY